MPSRTQSRGIEPSANQDPNHVSAAAEARRSERLRAFAESERRFAGSQRNSAEVRAVVERPRSQRSDNINLSFVRRMDSMQLSARQRAPEEIQGGAEDGLFLSEFLAESARAQERRDRLDDGMRFDDRGAQRGLRTTAPASAVSNTVAPASAGASAVDSWPREYAAPSPEHRAGVQSWMAFAEEEIRRSDQPVRHEGERAETGQMDRGIHEMRVLAQNQHRSQMPRDASRVSRQVPGTDDHTTSVLMEAQETLEQIANLLGISQRANAGDDPLRVDTAPTATATVEGAGSEIMHRSSSGADPERRWRDTTIDEHLRRPSGMFSTNLLVFQRRLDLLANEFAALIDERSALGVQEGRGQGIRVEDVPDMEAPSASVAT
ncbi:MAG: hypothetical protein M1832_002886 [Thelocarpon impressellum]|nr:MAG: hypothetical protein M1832_002886 [Thelocarpon impressellum]